MMTMLFFSACKKQDFTSPPSHKGDTSTVTARLNNLAIPWSTIGGTSANCWLRSVVKAPDGGYIAAGIKNSPQVDGKTNHGGMDMFVVKVGDFSSARPHAINDLDACIVSFATPADLVDAILRERNIEFDPGERNVQAKNPSEQGYIWPISLAELALNSACKDN